MTDQIHVGQGDPQIRKFKQIGVMANGDPILAEYVALEPGSIGGGGGVASSVSIADGVTPTQLAAVDVSGRVKVDGSSVTQPVSLSGGVSVTNFPATQAVSLATNTPDVTDRVGRLLGHVTVDNFPATQPVSGTFWQATQPVSGAFFQATQPVSEVSLDAAIAAQGVAVPANVVITGIRNSAGNADRLQGVSDNADGVATTAGGAVLRTFAEAMVFNGTTWDRLRGDATNGLKNNLSAIGGTALTAGQKAMASSIPVVVASDQSAIPTTKVAGAGQANILKTGSLVTTAVTADQVVLTYTVTAAKTFYLCYIIMYGQLTVVSATASILGIISFETPSVKLITLDAVNPTTSAVAISPIVFAEPIAVAAGTVIRVLVTPAAATSMTWRANFGGYEK